MRLCLLAAMVLSLAVFAGVTEFGIHGGAFLPTGDASDAYNISFGAGGNVLAHMATYAIEGSISYVFLSPEYDWDEFSAYMVPVLGGIRTYTGNIFYGGGLALHYVHVSWEESGEEWDDSNSELGAYGNIGTILGTGGTDVEISGKLHWIDFDNFWIGATGGIYF
ncbi:hypothetical protein GF402_09345 [Candidatus Fermentibacteria bacterium]|nr:hypothetical protein [Candidatus Fermentibacteria bacterium]